MYYISVDANNTVLAVSKEKTSAYLNVKFTYEYLNNLGIDVDPDALSSRVYNPYIIYTYNPAKGLIEVASNLSALKRGILKNLRLVCKNEIKNGFSLLFNGKERIYQCSLEDQICLQQALLLAEKNGFCELKCIINGRNAFVSHTLEECNLVFLEMSKFILSIRKKYEDYKEDIVKIDEEKLANISWDK